MSIRKKDGERLTRRVNRDVHQLGSPYFVRVSLSCRLAALLPSRARFRVICDALWSVER